jgi:BolA protein
MIVARSKNLVKNKELRERIGTMTLQIGRVRELIEYRLVKGLTPQYLTIENESYMHSVPENSETHFRGVVVADAFADQRQVQCHQAVYGLLSDLIGTPIHALALHTYGPGDWESTRSAPDSPACLGGSAK